MISVTIFFLLNVIIYALPLSLQGIGFVSGDPVRLLVNNSGIIVAFGFLTYFLYHSGIWLTRKSDGIIPSYQIVMINTSIYLAIIFNLLWIGASQMETIRNLFNWTFQEFFILIAGYLGISQSGIFSGETPTTSPDSAMLAPVEQVLVIGLTISLCYYLYVLYLGARKVHDLTRYESILVIGFVFTTVPVVFAAASLIIGEFLNVPSVFNLGNQ